MLSENKVSIPNRSLLKQIKRNETYLEIAKLPLAPDGFAKYHELSSLERLLDGVKPVDNSPSTN